MISWNQWLRLFSQPILHVFNHKKLYSNKKKRPFLEGLEERITPVNPSVSSILRNAGTAASTSASYTVSFSESVTGVDSADFTTSTSGGVASTSILVAGSGSTYTVTISGITGTGSISLNLIDNDTIKNSTSQSLGGTNLPGISFSSKTDYSTGTSSGPHTITTGQINADGFTDIITANGFNNKVSVLLGVGDGTFNTQTSLNTGTGTEPQGVAAADINGDGKLDLVTANSFNNAYIAGTVSVFLGNGNNTFIIKQAVATENGPLSVILGDFNSDGKLDIATANEGSHSVSILLGNGNGTFIAATNPETGSGTKSVAMGDVNGDGFLDLATADFFGGLSILLGNGDGSFKTRIPLTAGSKPFSVIMADLNGDGKKDLISANYNSSNVSILLGNGNGTFKSATSVTTGTKPVSVVAADLDGDGKIDLAVANRDSNSISLLAGNGDGTFKTTINFTTGTTPYSVTIADFNGDSKPDVATANEGSDNISVFLNTTNNPANFAGQTYTVDAIPPYIISINRTNGTSTNTSAVFTVTFSETVTGVDATDFNTVNTGGVTIGNVLTVSGSGILYTVTISGITGNGTTRLNLVDNDSIKNSALMPINGFNAPSFGNPTDIPTGFSTSLIPPIDINGDGKLDIVTIESDLYNYSRNYSTISIFLGNGNGTFKTKNSIQVSQWLSSIAISDFNTDGKLDIAGTINSSNKIIILQGNGDGSFFNQTALSVDYKPLKIITADLNQDNKNDLVITYENSNNISILTGNGNGTFKTETPLSLGNIVSGGPDLCIKDVNNDTKLDMVVTYAGDPHGIYGNSISGFIGVFLGNGNSTFKAATTFQSSFYPRTIACSDLNGDSKLDLVVGGIYEGTTPAARIHLGNGNGTFALGTIFNPTGGLNSIMLLDINGDGKIDLANAGFSKTTLMLGNGNGTFEQPQQYLNGTSFSIGDFNGDFKKDIILAVKESNYLTIFNGNNTSLFNLGNTNSTGLNPISTAIGDINNDGIKDIITVNYDSNSLSLILGNGDSTFKQQYYLPLSSATSNILLMDINSDSKLDLILANTGISIFLGNGNGTFQSQKSYATDGNPSSIILGDVNTDGKTDIITTSVYSSKTSVLLGNGNGTFQNPILSSSVGPMPSSSDLGDFNGDGNIDIIVTNSDYYTQFGQSSLGLLLGNGNGTFQNQVTFQTGLYPYFGRKGDFNNDGKLDIVTANKSGSYTVLLGNGNGTFSSTTFGLLDPNWYQINPNSLITNDINGDGKLDLIVGGSYSSNQFIVLLGNGNGTFAPTITTPFYGTTISLADMNNDSKNDLVVTSNSLNRIFIYTGNNTSVFTLLPEPLKTTVIPNYLAIADFNNDGKPDVVTANLDRSTFSVFITNGGGNLSVPTTFNPFSLFTATTTIKSSDFNGDGKQDLLIGMDNNITVFLGNGNGTFGTAKSFIPTFIPYLQPVDISIRDINNDGIVDLAFGSIYSNIIGVSLGNGNGTFKDQILLTTAGSSVGAIIISDINNDGKQDIVASNMGSSNNPINVFLGNGNGTFLPRQTSFSHEGSQFSFVTFTLGDINLDGKIDIIGTDGGYIRYLPGNGNGTFGDSVGISNSPTFQSSYYPKKIYFTDVTGDSNADIVVTGNGTTIFVGNGKGFFTRSSFSPGYNALLYDMNLDSKLDLVNGNLTSNEVTISQNITSYSEFKSESYIVDNTQPTIVIASSKVALKSSETSLLTFTLSEAASDFIASDIVTTGGTLSALTVVSGTSYTATFTPNTNSNTAATFNVLANSFTDAANNNNTAANQLSINIDTIAPTITITSSASALKSGQTATITFTLSEAASDFVASDIVTTGGTLSALTVVSGTSYTAVFSPTANSNTAATFNVLANTFTDAAGNNNTAANQLSINIDTVAPTITITSDRSTLKSGQTATITFTLSETASDFIASDIVTTGGTLSALTIVSGTSYTAVFTPTANSTTTATFNVAASAFTDGAGNNNTAATQFSIQVDTVAPTITIASNKTTLKIGETANLTFTLSEPASTTLISSNITVVGGALSNFAGSGTSYIATFTPNTDTTATATINVLANTFTDGAGNNNTAATQLSMSVDTVAPTITITSSASALKIGETATLTFTLSEASADFTGTDIVTVGGTLGALSNSGLIYTATFTPTANITTTATFNVASGTFTDAAGNNNTAASNTISITVDTIAPTITIASNKTALSIGETATITFTLSESSSTFSDVDIISVGGTLGTLSGSGTSYTATFTPTANTTETATINVAASTFTDSAGNNNTASNTISITVDTVAPTITITSSASSLRIGETATITFTLSEASSTFSDVDIVSVGGTLGTLSGSGTSYTATFTPNTNSTATATIDVAGATFTDAAGNNNTAAAQLSVAVDTLAPTITITSSASALKISETATLTFTLSESSSSFIASDITAFGGTLSALTVVSATSYTATFTPNTNSTTTATINVASGTFTDAAGNNNTPATQLSITVDTVAPTITITSSASALKSGQTATLTFTLSEAASDFAVGDIVATGGALSALTVVSTTSYTAVFTPTANSNTAATFNVLANTFTDAAGNNNTAATQLSVTVDTVAPTITIASSASALKSGQTATLTFTLSEASSTFSDVDIVSVGGTLGTLSGSGNSYTATFTPNTNSTATATINVAGATFTDAAGNNNTAATQLSVAVDTLIPTITITSDRSTLKSGQTATITFTLSETASDFIASDITTIGGALSGFAGSGTSYTATFTPNTNSTATTTINVAAATFIDAAGNANTAATQFTIQVDTVAPTITIASNKTTLKIGETANLTFTLSEPASTTLISSNITVVGGALSNFAGSGTSYIATFTPNTDTTATATINVLANTFTDGAGNNNTAATQLSMSVDTTAPTITINSNKTTLKIGETATLTFTLSEAASTALIAANITVVGGVLSSFAGSGTSYTATFTPTATSTTTATLNVAAGTFTDSAGNNNTAAYQLSVTVDTVAPTITITSNKTTLMSGETATLTFTISESSTNFTASDITATGGTLSSFAGSGNSYTATFTPSANSTATATINVAGATFTDAAGNNNTAATQLSVAVDTLIPTITITSSASALKSGQTATLTFTLSESSSNFIEADISITGGALSNFAVVSGTSYTATFTPSANSTATATFTVAAGTFTDAAGNNNTAASQLSVTVDTAAPTITITSNKTALKFGETATITFTLSEAASDFTQSDITVVGGLLSSFTGSGSSYTAIFTPTANRTTAATFNVLANTFSDAVGNNNTAATQLSITVDTLAPTINITSDKTALKSGETANLTFTLSESSTNFTASDITATGGTLSSFAGSGTSYTATFNPNTNTTATATFNVLANTFTDAAGNNNTAATQLSITVDTVAPTITITSNKTTLRIGETATLTFTLSETSSNFVLGNITTVGGTLGTLSGSGTSYTATFTPTANSTTNATFNVAAGTFTDSAGNNNTAATQLSITVDTVALTITIASDKTALKSGETATLTFTLSEATSDFIASDIVTTGGTLVTLSGSGTSYTAAFTPTTNSTATATFNVAAGTFTDAAGNNNTASTQLSITVDTIAPTITITSDKTALKSGETATLTFTLSEASSTFAIGDVTATGGTLGTLSGSGTSYTATFTPTANTTATATINVAAATFTDGAGNNNNTSNTISINIDTVAPTITITSSASALKSDQTATITFTLSEGASDFIQSDITVVGGLLSSFTGTGTSYTATFTPTASSTTSATFNVATSTFTDAVGNNNTAATQLSITVDTLAPTITITSDKTTLRIGQTATITFTLSEVASTALISSNITVVGGALSNFAGSGTSYTATFTPNTNSTATATFNVVAGSFTDGAGNPNTAATQFTILVDTTAPTITIASNKTALSNGETANLTFTLSESSSTFAIGDVTATGGTLGTLSGSGTSYTATFTPTANTTATATINVAASTFTDAAGNPNTAATQSTILVDTTAPTITIASNKTALSIGETATITFTLSESSSSFAIGDVTATGGALSNFAGSGLTYTATFTPTATSTLTATINVAAGTFTDSAGNNNTAASNTISITVDTVAPTITIASNKTALSIGETATITFTLSEAATDFIASDITTAGGTLGTLSGSGTSYTATFTPNTNSTVTATFNVVASTFTDGAGNLNTAAIQFTIQVDTTAPTITIASDKTTLRIGETATITFTLSETSSNFVLGNITTVGGTLGTLSGSGTSYTATFTPTANSTTTATFNVAAATLTDSAGNANTAATQLSVAVDTVAPTITIASDKTTLKIGQTATLTFTLSEATSDFIATDITVADGTLGTLSGSGTSYTATFTPTANSTTTATFNVATSTFTDAAGNNNTAAAQLSLSVDTVAPTIVISSSNSALKSGQTAVITFTLSEGSTDFAIDDIQTTGGTLSALTAVSAISYTAIFTPTQSSTTPATFNVSGNTFTDAAGNNNTASAQLSLSVDTVAPTIVISSSNSALKSGQTAVITFTLNEGSTDFTIGDIRATGGTLSALTPVSATSYTAIFTPTPSSTTPATFNVSGNTFTDAAGNNNTAAAQLSISVDTVAPTIVISSSTSTLKLGQTAVITFTLSEGSTDFAIGDIQATGGTLSALTPVSATSYTATFTPSPSSTTPATFNVAGNTFTDAAGNNNIAATQLSISVDTVAPTIVISSSTSTLKSGQTSVLTFTLSEGSIDFAIGDIQATGGTISALTPVSATSYTAIFTPTINSTTPATFNVAGNTFTDAAGNNNTAANQLSISVDTVEPTANFSPITTPTSTSINIIQINFSEAIIGFNFTDLTLTRNGNVASLNGISVTTLNTYSYTINNLASANSIDGTYVLTLNASGSGVTDNAGNSLITNSVLFWTYNAPVSPPPPPPGDTTPPSGTIGAVPSVGRAGLPQIAITFSESVTGFDISDISLTRGGAAVSIQGAVLTGSGSNYVLQNLANLTYPIGEYHLQIKANGTGITDIAGNALSGSNSADWKMVGPDNALISMRSPKMDGSMEIRNANTNQIVGTFTPFPGYNGAVHLLKGNFMGDGKEWMVMAAGEGGAPHIVIMDPVTGQVLRSWFGYGTDFRGGLFIAVGDVNGDGTDDLITGPNAGGGPHIKVYDGKTNNIIFEFMAYDPSFIGGVSVALADVNNDGRLDIVTGTGKGGGPHVRVFDALNGRDLLSFMAYDPSFRGGVFVAAGDIEGNGTAEIVTGSGYGGTSIVRVFDLRTLQAVRSFMAYDPAFLGGVRVGLSDRNRDGILDIFTGPGPGGGPHIKVFDGVNLNLIDSYFAGSTNDPYGVYIN